MTKKTKKQRDAELDEYVESYKNSLEKTAALYAEALKKFSNHPAWIDFMKDWFAAQAISRISIYNDVGKTDIRKTAKTAYDLADAMLRERASRIKSGKTKKHGKR